MPQNISLEICIDSVASALVAQEAGAQRVELCDNLLEGGTTPSAGMIALCREHISIGLHVLIRPRRGDFLYSDLEMAVMKHDIEMAKKLGADGVVLGVLQADGSIDEVRTAELVQLARPMSVTFHRAFDLTPDPFAALDTLIRIGVDRLLTSGQQASALAGADLIKVLVQRAGDHLIIVPGAGITEGNAAELIEKTGVKELHASLRIQVESQMQYRREDVPMGGSPLTSEYVLKMASKEKIKALQIAIG